MIADEERLETPKQLAARVGVKEGYLINTLQIDCRLTRSIPCLTFPFSEGL
jgi:hypothetical protein